MMAELMGLRLSNFSFKVMVEGRREKAQMRKYYSLS